MKVYFGTVIYDAVRCYLTDFFNSLANQTTQDFNLLIINEDVHDIEVYLKEFGQLICRTEIIQSLKLESPTQHRIRLIREAYYKKADLLIIGDSDDFFCSRRIELVSKTFLENPKAGFFFNELIDSDGKKTMPDLPPSVDTIDCLMEYNFLGMSNTALNIGLLDDGFLMSLEECNTSVFDWYLYSRIVLDIGTGKYVPDAFTIYRLHERNLAGVRNYSKENEEYERAVKRKQYRLMKKYDDRFEILLNKLEAGDYSLNKDEITKRHYWWDLIRIQKGSQK